MSAKIDKERCKGCELCVFYCPQKCLKLSEVLNMSGYSPAELINEESCNSCGMCYIMCPDYTIEIIKG